MKISKIILAILLVSVAFASCMGPHYRTTNWRGNATHHSPGF